jgi:hypothetical protein
VQAAKAVLEFGKKIKDTLPNSQDRSELEEKLINAEKAQSIAEVELVKVLGYKLCQCTFPPQIMLSIGHKEINCSMKEVFECKKCGKHSPFDGPQP